MAWTTPKTWAAGETLTAANFNTHIRDNLDAAWRLIAHKTSDQSVTSSTVLVSDNALNLTVAANEVWALEYRLRTVGTNTGAIKLGWTFPASATIQFVSSYVDNTPVEQVESESATASPSGSFTFGFFHASPLVNAVTVEGFYVGSGTAGTLTLQFAQQISDGTATTIKANSILLGMKLA